MKITLMKLNNIANYDEWLKVTIDSLSLSRELSANVLLLLQQRDQLGSVQIDEHVIMPHVVYDRLPNSRLIVSQLSEPIHYRATKDITTGIYIFSRPDDSSISKAVDCLTDESVIQALQNSELSNQQLLKLFS
ncbi:PTS sugar transporter subunit IIA [Limosilactobacillus coleohominis]|uniref:PTS sugar transporter subunit IIA n=1 Tax=Limosilactobacillus coleohominis TaxID=181675 RepID=A0ABS2GUT1_9LACO|nr:PTS sugar transporter subunit IIA [Limosilactobacillus coleohominis]MBM6940035.1 PTS sugar transporter subunit IIA [Limosilactobacillus coleohominis]MBM6954181.1 PTS sugar transporter subunit IIA [Limosilactobacillus coleohominis]